MAQEFMILFLRVSAVRCLINSSHAYDITIHTLLVYCKRLHSQLHSIEAG